jgi:hypothetical protein
MDEAIFLVVILVLTYVAIARVAVAPETLLRPSFIVWLSYLGIYGYPLLFYCLGWWEREHVPAEFLRVLAMFLSFGLIVILNTFSNAPRTLLRKIRESANIKVNARETRIVELTCVLILGAVFLIYFSVVPYSSTGLYAVLFDPENASIARERSLKLLDNQALKYAMAFSLAAFAPFLFVFSALSFGRAVGKVQLASVLRTAALMVFALFLITISGSRSGIFFALISLGIALMIRRWRTSFTFKIAMFLPVVTIPPVVLTLLREGRDVASNFGETYVAFFLWRIASGPLEVAIWYLDYAEQQGKVGLAAIPKLASLIGEKVVDLPNVIGLKYALAAGDTINAGTGFVFSYFAMFGVYSLVPSLLCLIALDGMIFFANRLDTRILIPTVATLAVPCIGFMQADFSVVWLSHGIVATFLLAFGLSKLLSQTRKMHLATG